MGERPGTGQQAERRALVADLVRTQATLQARSEQLQAIFASRWYRLARLSWRMRRPWAWRRTGPPRMAGEDSFVQPLDEHTAMAERLSMRGEAGGTPSPGLERPRGATAPDRGARLLLAGHSLSFCRQIEQGARRRGTVVREDRWRTHGAHDEGASAAALAWADVVHCEWCLGNAVWYSRNKRPGQRLVVRFHRMELETPYPGEVDLDRVDAVVFVARHVRELACERWGWDASDRRFHVVPNGLDHGALGRPKLPGAQFTLAAIGYVPKLKRLDLALDVLEALRLHDDRYRLLVKGREPWEYAWMSAREEECHFYEDLLERVEGAPGLRGAVNFESFGDDVPAFLQQAGWMVSSSEVEGHSVALAEAMASGAVPAIIDRAGATEQYTAQWVHADPAAAAGAILATQARRQWEGQAAAARSFAERWSWERLGPFWDRLLLDDGEPAQQVMART